MNIRAIKTANSIAAVNKIKAITIREVKDVNTSVPDIFIEKRNYMQSDEFIKDEHNKKMFDLIDELMIIRDKITDEIDRLNKTFEPKFAQGINGYTRIKLGLDKNPSQNFNDKPTFNTVLENMYKIVRTQISAKTKTAVK